VTSRGSFRTYKQRGEWAELLFMAQAAERGFNVSKPWGDSARYDVSVELNGRFLRVQIKSTSAPRGDAGYICTLKRTGIAYYTVEDVDFFAIYVVPEKVWYILPASIVLRLRSNIRLAPGNKGQKYEPFMEAWNLFRGAPIPALSRLPRVYHSTPGRRPHRKRAVLEAKF
jgi:hypothetical protein